MRYKRGTLEEFNIDDSLAKMELGWTSEEIKNGKQIEGESLLTTILLKQQSPYDAEQFLWKSEDGDLDGDDFFNINCGWRKKISNQTFSKYYLELKGDGTYNHNSIDPGTILNCGKNTKRLEVFNSEAECLARLEELNADSKDLD